jgi:hypothetical protein
LELRKLMPATALVAAGLVMTAGCGGTLEGKYRRGQITTSTSTPARGSTTTTAPGAPGSTSTSSTTVPTAGNAAGQTTPGESKATRSGGTILGSAVWRDVVSPLGGRQR